MQIWVQMHVQGVVVLLRSWCFGEKGGGEISKEEKKKKKKKTLHRCQVLDT